MSFKRGFLNSQKGRDALATDSSSSKTKTSESVIEATREDSSGPSVTDDVPSDNPPSLVGKPKRIEIPLDLHLPPPEYRGDKNRFIFRKWPRAPDGQVIRKEHPEYGKRTSNGYPLWGETLYDFYQTLRTPDLPNYMTNSSGSRLAAWMRGFGELDAAADELSWADSEGDPKQIFPCDVGQLICDYERNTAGIDRAGPSDTFGQLLLSRVPKLQDRLPFHLLPERLIVHDPWNTLSVNNVYGDERAKSDERRDIVHTLELSLSEEGKRKQLAEREAAEAADKARLETESWHVMTPDFDNPGPLEPDQFAVYAKIPPRPSQPTSIPEAHLYIRREDKCGSGNHSVVYYSELELPRWALVDDVLCATCFQSAIQKEIDERIEAGTLRPESTKGKEKAAEVTQTKTVVVDRSNVVLISETTNMPEISSRPIRYMRSIPHEVITNEYTGPVAYVYPKASWQSPERGPVCEHLQIDGRDPPLTARVKVCGKLSRQGDLHLAREAESYQAFPSHFFEHWNGYNLVQPLHDPTPCGALVPQFYGYYVPKGGFEPVVDGMVEDPSPDIESKPHLPEGYLSPILLLEHCGVPIELDDMSEDDKNLCAAMYFLFIEGGWTQNSMAERNVVVQPGPITEWPIGRGDRRKRSFRLIDFGRALPIGDGTARVTQNGEIFNLFQLFHAGAR